MHHVYILKSQIAPKLYVGETGNSPDARLEDHNKGRDADAYTRRYRPWDIVSCITVETKLQALKLESYLKSGAGRAFISKYLVPGTTTGAEHEIS